MKIGIRCNARHDLGLGDLVCGLILARAAVRRGAQPVLIVNDHPAVLRCLPEKDFRVHFLPDDISCPQEIPLLEPLIHQEGLDALFVIRFDQRLDPYADLKHSLGLGLGCVDFWRAFPPEFDLAVNWDPGAEQTYRPDEFPHTRLLLGPAHVLLQESVTRAAALVPEREPDEVRQVLVAMGGTDLAGLTIPVLRGLEPWARRIKARVIVGAGFADDRELADYAAGSPLELEVESAVSDMGRRLAKADLVITAGGLTLFECLALGRPCLSIAAVPHQEARCEQFAALGACRYVGRAAEVSPASLGAAWEDVRAPETRQGLRRRAAGLVGLDGADLVMKNFLAAVEKSGGRSSLEEDLP